MRYCALEHLLPRQPQQMLLMARLCLLPQHRGRRVVGAPAGLHRMAPRPQQFHGQLGLQHPWNVREELHFQEQPAAYLTPLLHQPLPVALPNLGGRKLGPAAMGNRVHGHCLLWRISRA
jgi:hypothetical protein